jgi:hypothetical protein
VSPDVQRTKSGPLQRILSVLLQRNRCLCKKVRAPWFDCPQHRTKTRGWCAECYRYDLAYRDGETWCENCGAGPLTESYGGPPKLAPPRELLDT